MIRSLTGIDIKPDNILISGLEERHPVVKLGDLGLGIALNHD